MNRLRSASILFHVITFTEKFTVFLLNGFQFYFKKLILISILNLLIMQPVGSLFKN